MVDMRQRTEGPADCGTSDGKELSPADKSLGLLHDRIQHLEYIAAMIGELKLLARKARCETLEDLLELARRETLRETLRG